MKFLYDYQMDAVEEMFSGCILNGGVGSGKSRTGLYWYFKENGGSETSFMKNPKDLYIITTAMKRDSLEWEGELAVYAMSTHPEANKYKNKIVVDSWNNIKKYKDVVDSYFLFDEDKLTGSGAWVKTFWNIARKNKWIVLSATPGDTYMDYFPIFKANGFFKSKSEFIRDHVVYSRYCKFPKIERYTNTGKLLKLKTQLLIDMDFKRGTTRHDIDIYTDYNVTKYKECTKNRWDPYKNEPITQASSLCYILRHITNEDVSRQIALLDLLEKIPKAIIFYSFDYELDILRKLLEDAGIPYGERNGHKHDRMPMGDRWVYLVNYASGAEGWNAITTDSIIFFSQQYSYRILEQASGRIDRVNTPFKDLYFYHLKTRAGIDVAISRALKDKKLFNEKRWTGWN